MRKPALLFNLIILSLFVLNNSCKTPLEYNINQRMELKENWSFQMKGETEWYKFGVA